MRPATSRTEYDAEGRIQRTTGYANPVAVASPTADDDRADPGLVVASPGKDAIEARRYDRDGRFGSRSMGRRGSECT